MPVKDQRQWADQVLRRLAPHLPETGSICFLAGEADRRFLARELERRGYAVVVPMAGLVSGTQLACLTMANSMPDRLTDTIRFYKLLDYLELRLGGTRTLAQCDGSMDWPERGVNFFFEPGEERSGSGRGLRVVCVGTHALLSKSRRTLWQRLRQHRGSAKSSGGDHRGSIFRRLVGAALARQEPPLPCTWGKANSLRQAASQLGMTNAEARSAESDLERRVSCYIGSMPFVWLDVGDPPGPDSLRGLIKKNVVALLSGHGLESPVDRPSAVWLGRDSDRELVRSSGLWNNRHVDEPYEPSQPSWLDTLERQIEAMRSR